ncbi:MAG: Gfo/Idh/MocA family oxidoreductase [Chloroflexota bacterium]|nr:Gfo/Idh/MocA family oxidoreductase [Chloroflexota bacterium]
MLTSDDLDRKFSAHYSIGEAKEMISVGVIGAGYWGPKHIRNFSELPQARMAMVADLDQGRLAAIQAQYPGIRTTTNYQEMLLSPDIEAIVVATPVSTHARFVREALFAGKHVLVEKPIARTSAEAEELIGLAEAGKRVLMVGHTFLYNPAVRALRELVQSGELGEIYYIHSQRLNLGLFQRDINVIWDLAPHDVSILMYVLGMDPTAASARGSAHVRPGIEDVAYLHLEFPGHVRAEIHLSWLDPNKVRRITVVGSKKMAVYDDVETLEKIRVYNKGVDAPPHTDTFGEFQLSYRYGDIMIPHLPSTEPLRLECGHFLECIQTGATPLSDGRQGLTVVRVLEAAQASLGDRTWLLPIVASSARANGVAHGSVVDTALLNAAMPPSSMSPAV